MQQHDDSARSGPSPPLHLQPGSPTWPKEFNDIEAPPSDLWLAGKIELLSLRPRVAIVGSRSPSAYGLEQACRFARALARRGAVIVSGLARGIDQAAHLGALDEGGATIAVLGCGVDRPWPTGEVSTRLLREGLLLSEFPPGQAPRRHHFPLRNRLISGLSSGVLVVEAARKSGSLITAKWALSQGRHVWALPGRVDQPMARGTHSLIRDGAMPVESPEELIEDFLGVGAPTETARQTSFVLPYSVLLDALQGETLSADELAQRLGWDVGRTLAELANFELDGFLRRGPGGLYTLLQ
ncbi:MAG: DNA processing protein [Planctomycetota bacterium]